MLESKLRKKFFRKETWLQTRKKTEIPIFAAIPREKNTKNREIATRLLLVKITR